MFKFISPDMQTFLPYASFTLTAKVLDSKRLGKQRVENLQILNALSGASHGWVNHPAVRMWNGYEHVLMEYHTAICNEWTEIRGYHDNCYNAAYQIYSMTTFYPSAATPWWMGIEEFHISHQSNLIRKDPDHYGPLFPGVPDDLPYYWPTKQVTPTE